jgi:hypothetical protein
VDVSKSEVFLGINMIGGPRVVMIELDIRRDTGIIMLRQPQSSQEPHRICIMAVSESEVILRYQRNWGATKCHNSQICDAKLMINVIQLPQMKSRSP